MEEARRTICCRVHTKGSSSCAFQILKKEGEIRLYTPPSFLKALCYTEGLYPSRPVSRCYLACTLRNTQRRPSITNLLSPLPHNQRINWLPEQQLTPVACRRRDHRRSEAEAFTHVPSPTQDRAHMAAKLRCVWVMSNASTCYKGPMGDA